MKQFFLLVLSVLISTFSQAQYSLIEKNESPKTKVTDNSKRVSVPFSKYRFNNGLTAIISEDHNNPLVNIAISYEVGYSASDACLPYLIFKLYDKGSRHLCNEEYQSVINQYSGTVFSEITPDRTTFSATVPRNLLETVLYMESDRQAYFIDSVTAGKFEKAKKEISDEMKDSFENHSYGRSSVWAQMNLFGKDHPYSRSKFGNAEENTNLTVLQLKKFFLDWYGSNNTIVTVTGDINTKDAIDLISKYFGTLTQAPKTRDDIENLFKINNIINELDLNKQKFISYKSDVSAAFLKIVFNTTARYDPDEKALNTLAMLLGNGERSVLYNELVKKGFAQSVNVKNTSNKYSGYFSIEVLAKTDTSLAVIVSKIQAVIREISLKRNIYKFIPDIKNFENVDGQLPVILPGAINQPDVKVQPDIGSKPVVPQPGKVPANKMLSRQLNQELKQKNKQELINNELKSTELVSQVNTRLKQNEINSLEKLQNKSIELSEMEMISGKPANLSSSLAGYDQLTPGIMYDVFDKYIAGEHFLYLSVVPNDKPKLAAAPDNISEQITHITIDPVADKDLLFRYPVYDINKKKPAIKDFTYNAALNIITDTFQNGLIFSRVLKNNINYDDFIIRLDASKISGLLPQIDVPKMIVSFYNEWFRNLSYGNPLKDAYNTGSTITFSANGSFIDMHISCQPDQLMIVKEAIVAYLYRPEYSFNELYQLFLKKAGDNSPFNNFYRTDFSYIINNLSRNSYLYSLTSSEMVMKKEAAATLKRCLSSAFYDMNNPKNIRILLYGNFDDVFYNDFHIRLSALQPITIDPEVNNSGLLDSFKINDPGNSVSENIYMLPRKDEDASIVIEYLQIPVETSAEFFTGELSGYYFGYYFIANQKKYNDREIKLLTYYRNHRECFALAVKASPDKIYDIYKQILNDLNNYKTTIPDKSFFNKVKNNYRYHDIVSNETNYNRELLIMNLISRNMSSYFYTNKFSISRKIKPAQLNKYWNSAYSSTGLRVLVIGDENILRSQISNTGNKIIKINGAGTFLN